MHVLVVAGGEQPAGVGPRADFDLVIAADSGLMHAAAMGVAVDVLVGDLDSAPAEAVAAARSDGIEVVEFPADKDATDLELAIELAVERGASAITVAAAFGGRLDHELASLGLLASPRWADVRVRADDGRQVVIVLRDRIELTEAPGTTISLIPWGSGVEGVELTGFRWPLRSEPLPPGSTRGVSNVVEAPEQIIEISAGTVFVVYERPS